MKKGMIRTYVRNIFSKHKLKVLFSNFRVLLIFLGVGLTAITVVAVVLLSCQKKNQVVNEMELTNLISEDQTIEEWHQDKGRGKKIVSRRRENKILHFLALHI